MMANLLWMLYALLLVSFSKGQNEPPFPHIGDIEMEFYQTEIQLTDVLSQGSAFATEYYDTTEGQGRIKLMVYGNKLSIFYYNETGEILEVTSNECKAWLKDESQFGYAELFYGWLNKDPLIIGPSATLWYADAHRNDVKYVGTESVRDIMCDKYILPIKDEKNDMNLTYYFAVSEWSPPYRIPNVRTPIRVIAKGTSSKDVKNQANKMPYNQQTDFFYFHSVLDDWLAFEPPIGIGCPTRKPTISVPKFPKRFRYSAEVYNLLKADDEPDLGVDFQQVWYDGVDRLGRLDNYRRSGYTSELYDFRKGVTYRIANDETCTIVPLRNSFMEETGGKMTGRMKDLDELIDDSFYYMGERRIRGIKADTFERVYDNAEWDGETYSQLVLTVYFTQEFMKVVVDGETEKRVPIYLLVTGYKTPKVVSIKKQYNIFAFDDVIWPPMYRNFGLHRCFPNTQEKSYFVLVLNENAEVAAQIEDQDQFFKEELISSIAHHAHISPMRVPRLWADYTPAGIYVTGLMLDRPPASKQFVFMVEAEVHTDDKVWKVETTDLEECARACIKHPDNFCKGLYLCEKDACYIKTKDFADSKTGHTFVSKGTCKSYYRAVEDYTDDELFLGDALKKLETAVFGSKIVLKIPNDKESETFFEVVASDFVIGVGPISGEDDLDQSYRQVAKYAQLDLGETTQEYGYIQTLDECYTLCKQSEDLSCSSFSYCPKAPDDAKQCRLTSDLYTGHSDDLKDNDNCNVYSINYLSMYTRYDGKVLVSSGRDTSKTPNAEECARSCKTELGFDCLSFEFCPHSKTCTLHDVHVLDIGGSLISSTGKCNHYAAKFTADYLNMGKTLIVDDAGQKRQQLSVEECARACSQEMTSCRSFNYCPNSQPYGEDSTCLLSTKALADDGIKTAKNGECHHYEKKTIIEKAGITKLLPNPKGYTSSGFAGLVIGTLIFGLIVGALVFVAYSYFRSRSSDGSMTVKFMKQDM